MNVLAQAAAEYLAAGWSVIPIAPGRKKPLIPWAEYQRRLPNEAEISQWWSRWPDANVGVVTGRASNLVVLDVDVRYGGDPNEVFEQAPTGLTSRTGGGGFHFFYRYPEEVEYIPSRPLAAFEGVDCKADGGFVVVPPSISEASGRLYAWIKSGEPGDLPPHILAAVLDAARRFTSAPDAHSSEDDARWLERALKGVGEGSRNAVCARLAGYLFLKGVPKDVAAAMLAGWDCLNRPPLGENEVIQVVHSVYRTAARHVKRSQRQPQPLPPAGGRADGERVAAVPLDQFMREHGQQETGWTVKDWLPDATIGFVVAPPGSFKTWLLFDAAVSVATGRPFLGKYRVDQPGPVLILQQEDHFGDMAHRLGLILASRLNLSASAAGNGEVMTVTMPPDVPIYVDVNRSFRFGDAEAVGALDRLVDRLSPRLVLLDPLYSAADTDDYMAKAAAQMLCLKAIRDRSGCSFLIAHHTSKGNQEGAGRERLWGSQFLNALLETGWQVARTNGDPNGVVVHRHFKVSEAPAEVELRFSIKGSAYEVQVLDAVADGAPPLDSSGFAWTGGVVTVRDAMAAWGVNRVTAWRRLKKLEERGRLRPVAKGKWEVVSDVEEF